MHKRVRVYVCMCVCVSALQTGAATAAAGVAGEARHDSSTLELMMKAEEGGSPAAPPLT